MTTDELTDALNAELDVLLNDTGVSATSKEIQALADEVNEALLEAQNTQEEPPVCTINKELVGTWFLYRDSYDYIFITKDKPTLVGGQCILPLDSTSGWMWLIGKNGVAVDDDTFTRGSWSLVSKDFNQLKLPRMEKRGLKEIEIMPSGKVYFY